MKFIASVLLLFSINSFSKYNDGFHAEPEETCSSGDCLFVNDSIFEIISYEDQEGFEIASLNKKSDLVDVFIKNIEACYTGDHQVVHKIVSLMRGVNEFNYYTGGHILVTNLATTNLDNEVSITFKFKTDYNGEEVFIRNVYISPCSELK